MGKGHASTGVWPWAACGADAEDGRRAGATRGAHDIAAQRRSGLNVLLVHCLKFKNSKNLYKSAQNFEYKSCRSQYHLQLSQRPYGVFLNGFCTKGLPTLNATQFQ
jgi:hypothetical protein